MTLSQVDSSTPIVQSNTAEQSAATAPKKPVSRVTAIALIALSAVITTVAATVAYVQAANLAVLALSLGLAAAGTFAMVKLYNAHIRQPLPAGIKA